MSTVQPQTLAEIQEICAGGRRLLPVGACTKSSLSGSSLSGNTLSGNPLPGDARDDVTLLDMRGYSGIVSYDASEFLITVRGGTTITELAEALAAEGQYLPFDPVFAARGATIGGSIASGISGPCRLLYGGLRDFMLEVALCDGAGREIRGGGKVVKNVAGFDLPKLIIGSYGRMGAITEATLKVFPKPQGWLTVRIEPGGLSAALETGLKLLSLPLPIAAVEIEQPATLLVRLAGPLDSLPGMARRVTAQIGPRAAVALIEPGAEERQGWAERAEFAWAASAAALARVAIAHHDCRALCDGLNKLGTSIRFVISCGASVAWIATESAAQLGAVDDLLKELKLAGVVVCGPGGLTLLGDRRWVGTAERIRQALDPERKMLEYA